MTYIRRDLLPELQNHLKNKEISLIVGARQVGKTTLMEHLKKDVDQNDIPSIFLSLDNERHKKFFHKQNDLINKLNLEFNKNHAVIFIDEIQRKQNAGLFLKGIYDLGLPYKFVISGSGSLELKEKIHESLAGRKLLFELSPISFKEFVNFKTEYKYSKKLNTFFSVESEITMSLLQEYLSFGGYPRVILEKDIHNKTRIIDEIFSSYIEKDISALLKLDRTSLFSDLIKLIASQIGQLINYNTLASTVNLAFATIKNYLWYAERTFILQRVNPYHKNFRKEIAKSPIAYFNDLGLRNYCVGLFNKLSNPVELGYVFENFIYSILNQNVRFTPVKINFWRTTDKAEVDFILSCGQTIIPIEIKYKNLRQPEITRSLRSFIIKYNPKTAFIINLTLDKTTQINNTIVKTIPFYKIYSEPLLNLSIASDNFPLGN